MVKSKSSSGTHEYFTFLVPHQCDYEPACPPPMQRGDAHAAGTEAGTAAGTEADTGVGTAAYTEAATEAEVEAGSEAAAWPLRGTKWMRLRRMWRSPGPCGLSRSLGSAGWD